jgi:YHS domain-containing protein
MTSLRASRFVPAGSFKSKPTWWNTSGCAATSAFLLVSLASKRAQTIRASIEGFPIMSELDDFRSRLDAAFALLPAAIEHRRSAIDRDYQQRQQRFAEEFLPAVAKVREIFAPRSDALVARFKDIIHLSADVSDDFSKIAFSFDSSLARVTLRFDFVHDEEVRKLILVYDLEILPILMKFDNHAVLEMPLAAFDEQAVTEWLESRMIGFIRSFAELNENQSYLNDQMVEDPVARMRMPKAVARETLHFEGQTYYFISAETRREFEKRHTK